MFTAAQLTAMQTTQNTAMPESVTIKRRNMATDGFGGHNEASLSTIATGVAARITQAQVQAMGGQGDRNLELEKWIIRVPFGTDLQDRDQVTWGTSTLIIEDVKAPRSYGTAISATGEIVK